MGRPNARRIVWLTGVSLSALFGLLLHYRIFERDVFFHIRVGEEIVRTGRVLTQDFWTYPSRGQPWYNHEWLATVVSYFASLAAPNYALLPTLRALLAALTFLAASRLIRLSARSDSARLTGVLLLLPALYVGTFFQMRPELYATLLFCVLASVWLGPGSSGRRISISAVILLLWSNLHNGTLPFGLLFLWASVLASGSSRPAKTALLLALPLLWIATPIGIEGPRKALHFFTHSDPAVENPDARSFSLGLLRYDSFGPSAWLWLSWILAGSWAYGRVRSSGRFQGTPYARPAWFWALNAGFVSLGLLRIRAIPYALIFLLPVLASAIDFAAALRRRGTLLIPLVLALAAACYQHFARFTPPLGFGVHAELFPIQAVRFIQENRPLRQLLNETSFGGYLMDTLRDYPVFDATSGEVSEPYVLEKLRAAASARSFRAFLEKYGVHTAVMGYWEPRYGAAGARELETYEAHFPAGEWALVFFDNASSVLVRREPAHAELIRRHGYELLLRYPPDEGAIRAQAEPAFTRRFEAELDRCLAADATSFYCLAGRAFLARSRGDDSRAEEHFKLAREARPKSSLIPLELLR